MNIWILIAISGFISAFIGIITFIRNYPKQTQLKHLSPLIVFLLPLLIAFTYVDTLITDLFPGLSFLDLLALYFIGMISGFFTALYFLQHNSSIRINNINKS